MKEVSQTSVKNVKGTNDGELGCFNTCLYDMETSTREKGKQLVIKVMLEKTYG